MRKLLPEQILDNRYRLIRVIGSGTFGTVWCAEHLALRSMVAVKVLDPAAVTSNEVRERFIREAWAAAALRSPHVVQILDSGTDGNTTFIAMELLEGESLEQRLARRGCLDVVETERIVRQVGRAIDRAHAAGIVHRDLKPGNIFVQSNDGDELVKVLDFGIAKTDRVQFRSAVVGVTPAGVVLGTPQYMSPEQVQGASDLDYRTDIWSLGMIAFECLLGRTAFDGGSVSEVLHAIVTEVRPIPSRYGVVPQGFDAWFARACAIRPADRHESGKVAADDFARRCEIAEPSASSNARVESDRSSPLPGGPSALGARTLRGPASWQSAAAAAPATGISRLRRRRAVSALVGLVGLLALCLAAALRSESEADTARSTPPALVAEEDHAPSSTSAVATASSTAAAASTPVVAIVSREADVEAAAAMVHEPAPVDPGGDVREDPMPTPPAPHRAHSSPPNRAAVAAPAPTTDKAAPAERPAARRGPARARDACDPPWVFDERGQPKAKPECL